MTNWGRGRPSLTSSENTPCSRYMFVMLLIFDDIASELFRTTLTSWTTAGRWCSSWWRSTGLPGEPTTSPGAWTSEKIKKIWPQTPWLWTNKWNVWTYIKYPRIGCTPVCMNNCANMAGKCPKKIERRDICHSLETNLPIMNGEVQLRCIKTNTMTLEAQHYLYNTQDSSNTQFHGHRIYTSLMLYRMMNRVGP